MANRTNISKSRVARNANKVSEEGNLIEEAFRTFERVHTTGPASRSSFFAGATFVLRLMLNDASEQETVAMVGNLMLETADHVAKQCLN